MNSELELNFTKEDVDQLKPCAGIYSIVNQQNSKKYIGQSKNIKNRLKNHLINIFLSHHTSIT